MHPFCAGGLRGHGRMHAAATRRLHPIPSLTTSTQPASRSAFDVVAMAASLGGLDALSCVLGALPANFPVPILVVQHLSAQFPSHLVELLSRRCALGVTWALPGQLL